MPSLLSMNTSQRKQFAFEQIRSIPQWDDVQDINDFDMTENKDGLTNVIYKLCKKVNEDDYPILFRIYGAGTDRFLNRGKELEFFHILSKNHFGINLIKDFGEGRLEEWKVGFVSLNDRGVRNPVISRKIAEKLADMHNMKTEDDHFDEFSSVMRSWVNLIKEDHDDAVLGKVDKKNLLEEINRNEVLINRESSDKVYGHQDLLRGNVLINCKEDVLIVDFEYTCLLAAPLDIAHHYCEWMTRYDDPAYCIDMTKHPSKEEEINFIRSYLQRRHGKEVTEEEVETIRHQVHRFQCFSFFFWAVWAIMQTELGADWDSRHYALSRYALYMELKKKYYGEDCLPILSK